MVDERTPGAVVEELLLVEDTTTEALYLKLLLEAQGYRVRIAKDGVEALDAIRRAAPAAVVSDVLMPRMDGFELCATLKADAALARLPVILLTSLSDPADVARGLECGADYFIFKPVDEQQLLSCVALVLAQRQVGVNDDARIGIEVVLSGRRFVVTSDRLRMLNLLLATYEAAATKQRELEVARAAAEAANVAKSTFLATMSHEIRTPMNGVLGMVELLAHTRLTEHQAELVSTIRQSARVLLGLIDDILDFSKIEAGRLALEIAPLALTELVEGLCASLAQLAGQAAVDLLVHVSPHIPAPLLGDEVRLRQLLYNLVGNAIKFSGNQPGRRGRVEVRVALDPAAAEPAHGVVPLLLSVSDNGIGMDAATREQLFTAFSQGGPSISRRFGGTGLGLAICQRLVELMHGTIEVDSAPGDGSRFLVRLALAATPAAASQPTAELVGVTCVIVAGGALPARDLADYLEHAGATVMIAIDRAAAIPLIATAAGSAVVIQDCGHARPALAELRGAFAAACAPRHLLITRGRRRRARIAADDVVEIDGDALRLRSLVRAVAMAVGRASPELPPSPEPLPALRPPPSIAAARAQGRLVLVAEDDAINQKVILQQLALLGYAAELASDGQEALRMWRAGRYALLFTDLHMPGIDGYALAATIRRAERGGDRLPIIALTANALSGEVHRARQAGIDGYLTKPVRLELLRATLARWLPVALPSDEGPAVTAGTFDIDVPRSLIGDDPAALRELLQDFLQRAPLEAEALRNALRSGDTGLVARIAHRVKSSARAVGGQTLGDCCAELEYAARVGGQALTDVVAVLEHELQATLGAIAASLECQALLIPGGPGEPAADR